MPGDTNPEAIAWIHKEVLATLKQASDFLEAYLSDSEDTQSLHNCKHAFKQIFGIFQIVELQGASLLTESLECLVDGLYVGRIGANKIPRAVAILLKGMRELPLYLEQVRERNKDQPLVLLPLINQVRKVYSGDLLEESDFFDFSFEFEPVDTDSESKFIQEINSDKTQKLLETVRQALSQLVSNRADGPKSIDHLKFLINAMERLEQLSSVFELAYFWAASKVVFKAIRENQIEDRSRACRVLVQIDQAVNIIVNAEPAALTYPPVEPFKKVLYFILRYALESAAARSLLDRYQLTKFLPKLAWFDQQRAVLKRPGFEAYYSLSSTFNEEIKLVKEQLDLFARNKVQSLGEIRPLLSQLASLKNILEIMNLEVPKKLLEKQLQGYQALPDDKPIDDAKLMELANVILYVESSIAALGSEETERFVLNEKARVLDAQRQVIAECRSELEQCKEYLVNYIQAGFDVSELQLAEAGLCKIDRSLRLIGKEKVAQVVNALGAFIKTRLVSQVTALNSRQLDLLADAVSAVDCFLERLLVDSNAQDRFLQVSIERLAELGWEPDSQGERVEEPSAPEEADAEPKIDALPCPSPEAGLSDAQTAKCAVDQEIVDIFLEEVDEILAELKETLATLESNPSGTKHLEAVRRAFHTLKGSGRMVEANLVGDLSWQIERLLNYFLDTKKPFDFGAMPLLKVVTRLVPHLVECYAKGAPDDLDLERLERWVDKRTSVSEEDAWPPLEPIVEYYLQTEVGQASPTDSVMDPGLVNVFVGEAKTHLDQVRHYMVDAEGTLDRPFSPELLRALHTLKGSSKMAGVGMLSEVVSSVEPLVKRLSQVGVFFDDETRELLNYLVGLTEKILEHLPHLNSDLDSLRETIFGLVKRIEEKHETTLSTNADNMVSHSAEATWFAQSIEVFELLSEYSEIALVGVTPNQLQAIFNAMESLSYNASSLDLWPYVHLIDILKEAYKKCFSQEASVTQAQKQVICNAHQFLVSVADAAALGVELPNIDPALEAIEALLLELDGDAQGTPVNASSKESNSDISFPVEQDSEEDDLTEIFLEEVLGILESTKQNLGVLCESTDHRILLESFMRDFHLLKGASKLAGIDSMGELAGELELLCEILLDKKMSASKDVVDVLFKAQAELEEAAQALTGGGVVNCSGSLIDKAHVLVRRLLQLDRYVGLNTVSAIADHEKANVPDEFSRRSKHKEIPCDRSSGWVIPDIQLDGLDLDIVDVFIDEAQEIIESSQVYVDQFVEKESVEAQNEIKRLLHTLKGGARLSGFDTLGARVHELETRLMSSEKSIWNKAVSEDIYQCLDFSAEYIKKISRALTGDVDELSVDEAVVDNAPIADSEAIIPQARDLPIEQDIVASNGVPITVDMAGIDPEMLPVFIEEACETMEDMGRLLGQWDQELHNGEYAKHLGRLLHTLKGGARLSGVNNIGDLSHNFETFLTQNENRSEQNLESLLKGAHERYDQLVAAIDMMRTIKDDSVESKPPVMDETVVDINAAVKLKQVVPQEMKPVKAQPKKAGPQEMIRVGSDLLERLVNMAGETSIARARVEQAVNDFSFVLDDMHMTVARMGEKIRQVESELETQVLSRHVYPLAESVSDELMPAQISYEHQEDFDPLEMDRYSLLHHLAKSLSESASDLADLKDTLRDKMRSAESLLMLQARLNTQLQEGLMQTRMVPFSRLSPKLRRVIRQVSSELGKEVELQIVNEEGELDRNVLERMVAPLEHMLRNSVDHGIEIPEVRLKLGKAPAGKITLTLSREANEVVLRLADDGAGIDLERVKAKAIRNGLMTIDAKLSDNEILQFIFRSGFSTATNVTQISGRGVGMDVVYSEIKQLGGSVKILSESGLGSEFVIRLPFTVAVSRALMVMVAEDYYAIPLTHIEGLVRINTVDLKQYYKDPESRFNYMGKDYEVRYLGGYVHNKPLPSLGSQAKPMPVLLARNADRAIAIQVDALIGSKEIVVKTVGPQLSRVIGLSGATILGDGSVVIILDLNALIRADIAARKSGVVALNSDQTLVTGMSHATPLVMVVDDSVTVRKVTTRLLERNGYEVVTAKDGVDAVTKLREHRPDLMLLDIEMPRMDGFEVASHVRHDPQLKSIPIIMVSSRTGDKHKERAASIGVNNFIGKPYQETHLLSEIQDLVTAARLNA